MSAYQQQFGRVLPEAYEEVQACAVCGKDQPCECEGITASTIITRRVDRKPFVMDDLKVLFPERYK
jgi:hypothetical protein